MFKNIKTTDDLTAEHIHNLATRLNTDVGQYIYSKYDAGTQASFLAIHSDSRTPAEARVLIQGFWDWIKLVMQSYYAWKVEVLAGTRTTWDFSQFDLDDPGLDLSDFV